MFAGSANAQSYNGWGGIPTISGTTCGGGSSGGASLSSNSNMLYGIITFGSSSGATTCTLNWASTRPAAPTCLISPEGAASFISTVSSATNSSMTIKTQGVGAGTVYDYICYGDVSGGSAYTQSVGGAPTWNAGCGGSITSIGAGSNSLWGNFTFGGSAGNCTINWSATRANKPACIATVNANNGGYFASAVGTTTTLTINEIAGGTYTVYYQCLGS